MQLSIQCNTSPTFISQKFSLFYRYGAQKATGGRELKPPDLWIHHDQMELKEKVRQGEHPGLTRNPHEADVMIDIMEKKKGSYIGKH